MVTISLPRHLLAEFIAYQVAKGVPVRVTFEDEPVRDTDRTEVTLTAGEVAAFFAALDPTLKVYVRNEDYEDGDLDQWYVYRIRFRVIEADRWIDTLEAPQVETLRQLRGRLDGP
jgi:hypothetical protein